MEKFIGLLKFCASVVCFILVISAQNHSAKVEAELIKLQNDWATARIKRDVPFLEKLYAKEFQVTALDGNPVTRAADIANFASGDLKPEIVRDDEMKVAVYGETAIVTGIEYVKGDYKNFPGEYTLRFTNIYVRREGRWQMISHHSTEIRKPSREEEARQPVLAFFEAFNKHEFEKIAEITTEDWVHINPLGGSTKGRAAVLKELEEVHSTFLKGVSMTIQEMSTRFVAPETAVVTVTNRIDDYTTPDGVKHENERQIKTFVVVRRGGKWLIAQDQNTIISMPPNNAAIEETVRRLDDEERKAALTRDVKSLERLWSEKFTVNAPNNTVVAGKQAVLDTFVRSGIIDFSSYQRKIETVLISGDAVFVMGLETLVPNKDAPTAGLVAGKTIHRRYTNVWRKESNVWRLFARHANIFTPR